MVVARDRARRGWVSMCYLICIVFNCRRVVGRGNFGTGTKPMSQTTNQQSWLCCNVAEAFSAFPRAGIID